jgi:hypothetical protein
MRQELIEKAVQLLGSGNYFGIGWVGAKLTDQEYEYAYGVIDDMRDDKFDELIGREGAAANLERRRRVRAAVPK